MCRPSDKENSTAIRLKSPRKSPVQTTCDAQRSIPATPLRRTAPDPHRTAQRAREAQRNATPSPSTPAHRAGPHGPHSGPPAQREPAQRGTPLRGDTEPGAPRPDPLPARSAQGPRCAREGKPRPTVARHSEAPVLSAPAEDGVCGPVIRRVVRRRLVGPGEGRVEPWSSGPVEEASGFFAFLPRPGALVRPERRGGWAWGRGAVGCWPEGGGVRPGLVRPGPCRTPPPRPPVGPGRARDCDALRRAPAASSARPGAPRRPFSALLRPALDPWGPEGSHAPPQPGRANPQRGERAGPPYPLSPPQGPHPDVGHALAVAVGSPACARGRRRGGPLSWDLFGRLPYSNARGRSVT